MKVTTAEEMRQIDRVTSERHGVPSLTLMENAGTHVSDYVLRRYPPAQRIAVVCGKGNNGGDGFVAARKLHEAGKKVDVLLLGDPAEVKGDAAAMLAKLPVAPIVIRNEEELKAGVAPSLSRPGLARQGGVVPDLALNECDLILDAILGTGFKPPVSGLIARAIELINASPVPVFAVDIPSGASADAFAPEPHLRCRADAIVTFTAPRPAHVFA
ncbi:MAG: NAD(P)H-hydrate epimerase, partial [Terriglobales bacterium]